MTALTAATRRRGRKPAEQRPGGLGRTPFSYLVLILLALFAALPLLVLLFNSMKSSLELGTNPLGFPSHLDFSNFAEAWTRGNMARGLTNSAIIVAGTILGTWICAGTAAYALARLDLPYKRGV